MRELGRFKCYAMLLVLPGDTEAIRYLADYGRELDIISGSDCLVLVLTKTTIAIPGYPSNDQDPLPHDAVEHVGEGYSVRMAAIFGIPLTDFPCLLLFRDIRSEEFALIPLKGLSLENIIARVRAVFSSVQYAIAAGQDPLTSVKKSQAKEKTAVAGRQAASFASELADKTLEAALKTLIELTLKPPA
jgi:hypothetical protein